MIDTGIFRRIDDMGRIVLPKELCSRLKIQERDSFSIFEHNGTIVLKPDRTTCFACGQHIEEAEEQQQWVIIVERDKKADFATLMNKKSLKYRKLPLMTQDEWVSYLKGEYCKKNWISTEFFP